MTTLPPELVAYILYSLGGLEHSVAPMIKEYVQKLGQEKKCFVCNKSNIGEARVPSSYVSHQSLTFLKNQFLEKNPGMKIYSCFECCH